MSNVSQCLASSSGDLVVLAAATVTALVFTNRPHAWERERERERGGREGEREGGREGEREGESERE